MMESEILKQLEADYPTPALQQARLMELVDNFGSLSGLEAKFTVADILCLARLLYENGDQEIVTKVQIQVLQLRLARPNEQYRSNLDYLSKCLTAFKPTIFKTIQHYFSDLYQIPPEWVICLPKLTGQQIGAKAEIKRTPDDKNPILFYIKAHYEFCSKSHPQFFVITSDKSGEVDFKELFIYKVLEYIGYGPKTHFIVDCDPNHARHEEGILIATQGLGYTKRPEVREKSFQTFREAKENLSNQPIEMIDPAARIDIIAIDMLSRAFLLEDVMVNQNNFGVTIVSSLFEPSPTKTRWRIIDFIPPRLIKDRFDDYSYARHYPGGVSIFYSFKVGNISHTYDEEEMEVVNRILTECYAKDLWLPTIDRLSQGWKQHLPVAAALERAFTDIEIFMSKNAELLRSKPERMERRMKDLKAYQTKALENFIKLEQGVREYHAAGVGVDESSSSNLTI